MGLTGVIPVVTGGTTVQVVSEKPDMENLEKSSETGSTGLPSMGGTLRRKQKTQWCERTKRKLILPRKKSQRKEPRTKN